MATTTWGEYAEEAEKAGGGFGKHPNGVFNMRVDTADTKPAKNDRRAILARMVTIDGPAAGKSILNNMSPFKNDGDPNGFFMQELAALGFGREANPQFWATLDAMTHEQGMTYIAQAIIGAQATVTVNERKYMGEMTDNVKGMVPLGTKAVTTVLEPEIPAAVPTGTPVIPAAAPAAVVNVAAPVAVPVAAAPAPVAVPVAPVAAPVAAPPVAAPVAAAPAPVAQPVVAAPPVAVPVAAPAAVPEAVPADVPTAVVTPVAAPVPPVERPEGAPF